MAFTIEEPVHEHSTKTFHGREPGYSYLENPKDDYYQRREIERLEEDYRKAISHTETFGKQKWKDHYTRSLQDEYHHLSSPHLVEPLVVSGDSHYIAGRERFLQ